MPSNLFDYWAMNPDLMRAGLIAHQTGESVDQVLARITDLSRSATASGKPSQRFSIK